MGGAESVIDIDVSVACQLLCKLLLTLLHGFLGLVKLGCALLDTDGLALFFRIETQVLEQQGLAGVQRSSFLLSVAAVRSELHINAQSLRDLAYDLLQAELRVALALGLAHVAHHDYCTAVGQNLLQCGQGTANAGVVCHIAILIQWHIEIYTNNGLLA